MGPKKRGAAAETAAQSKKPPPTSEPQPAEDASRSLPPVQVPDNWTDEQEITLFKAIIKWKPAGRHKHFRMLSIANLMKNHGVADTHTNIPGIWKKLESLYNLELVDEQEEAPDEGYESPSQIKDFDLPDSIYYDLKMQRRLALEPSPEAEEEKPVRAAARNAKGSAKPKKETKAETAASRRGAKRRKVEEEAKQEEEEDEEAGSDSDETEEAPAPAPANKRKGRATRAKSANPGTAKSTPAPDRGEEEKTDVKDNRKGNRKKAATVTKAKPQPKRGRPTAKKKEEDVEPAEDETEGEEESSEEGSSGEDEEGSEEEEEDEEEEEEEEDSEEESAPPSPTSTKRSRSVASTRAPPKGKKGKAPSETVRRSSRKK